MKTVGEDAVVRSVESALEGGPTESVACPSCGSDGVESSCPSCGQRASSLHTPVTEFVRETLDGLFSFDSRVWRTLITLFLHPGLLTVDYWEGRGARSVAPLRLYALTYLGDDTPGETDNLHFPGIGEEATRLLVAERRAGLLGIDTASIDHGQSTDFIAHQMGAAAGVPNLENVADLSGLPPTGFLLAALPMKIAGGTGAPVRIVALIPPS